MAASPIPQMRTYLGAFIDRLFARSLGLPPELSPYTTTLLSIPLPSGITLAATLFAPTAPPHGLLVTMSPYPRSGFFAMASAHIFAARGYTTLIISCRGTTGSSGALDPALTEREDFTAVLPWMRQQSWYPGTFTTIGASFTAFTQFALLRGEKIPDHIGSVLAVGPHDFARHHWGSGAFRLDRISWADLIVNQEDPTLNMFWKMYRMSTAAKRLQPVYESLPVVDGVKAFFGDKNLEWLVQSMRESNIDAPYWAEARHGTALEKINVPVFLQTGWMDMFLYQTMEQYRRLHERGVDVQLVVGPWTHMQVSGNTAAATIEWLDEHVAGKPREKPKEPPVKVYITGAEEWRHLEKWPPASKPLGLCLLPDTGLGLTEEDVPPAESAPTDFVYDPLNPTPAVGGPQLTAGGKMDNTSLAARSDVLCFTTAVLPNDVEVVGPPVVELLHKSDIDHVDLFVRLCEVDARGRPWNVTETFRRFHDRGEKGTVVLKMTDCGHRFKKGCKIRLLVAGGNFPMYSRNLGADEDACTGKTMKASTHTIFHGQGGLSKLVLPIAV